MNNDNFYTDPTANDYSQGANKKGSKSTLIIILSVVVGVLLLGVAAFFLIFFSGLFDDFELPGFSEGIEMSGGFDEFNPFNEKEAELQEPAGTDDNKDHDPDEPVETELKQDDPEPEDVKIPETTPDPEVDLHSMLGYWHRNGDSFERELIINSVDDYSVNFSLYYDRMYSLESVTAPRSGDTATFHYSNGLVTISGSLRFEKSKIILDVASSSVPGISAETMTFSGRHNESWFIGKPQDIPYTIPVHLVAPVYTEYTPYQMSVYVIEGLNLRTGPDTSYDRIRLLPQNTAVVVHGWNESYSWAYVYDIATSQFGWVAAQYLQ